MVPTSRVLVTGATGFVGRAMLERLQAAPHAWQARAAVRNGREDSVLSLATRDIVAVGGIDGDTGWHPALEGIDAVLHLAGLAHQRDSATLAARFRAVNIDGTLNLARQAKAAGARRFVFVSSIKVNGEQTPIDAPYLPTRADPERPGIDAYAKSKALAELGLQALAEPGVFDVVIVRPPLVYGPGVRANFAALARAVHRGIPLPLGSVRNLRSLVYVQNLADLLAVTLDHPQAPGCVFLVSDGADVSTPELIRRLATAMQVSPRLLPWPPALLRLAGRCMPGARGAVDRLIGSLRADVSANRERLGWTPPYTLDEALLRTFGARAGMTL